MSRDRHQSSRSDAEIRNKANSRDVDPYRDLSAASLRNNAEGFKRGTDQQLASLQETATDADELDGQHTFKGLTQEQIAKLKDALALVDDLLEAATWAISDPDLDIVTWWLLDTEVTRGRVREGVRRIKTYLQQGVVFESGPAVDAKSPHAVAYVDLTVPGTVFIRSNAYSRSAVDLASTVVHEVAHSAAFKSDIVWFGGSSVYYTSEPDESIDAFDMLSNADTFSTFAKAAWVLKNQSGLAGPYRPKTICIAGVTFELHHASQALAQYFEETSKESLERLQQFVNGRYKKFEDSNYERGYITPNLADPVAQEMPYWKEKIPVLYRHITSKTITVKSVRMFEHVKFDDDGTLLISNVLKDIPMPADERFKDEGGVEDLTRVFAQQFLGRREQPTGSLPLDLFLDSLEVMLELSNI